MKYFLIILFLCSKMSFAIETTSKISLSLSSKDEWQILNYPKGKIKLLSIEDNRCPKDVECITQGKLKAKFKLNSTIFYLELLPENDPNKDKKQSRNIGPATVTLLSGDQTQVNILITKRTDDEEREKEKNKIKTDSSSEGTTKNSI